MSEKKKIVISTISLVEGFGGVSSYAHDFAEYFRDQDITIITDDQYQPSPGDPFRFIHFDASLTVANARKFVDLITRLDPDIVVNSWSPLLTVTAPYLPDKIRIITISHFVNGELAWVAGHNHRYIDRIVALSTYGRRYFRRTFGSAAEAKADIIFNPVPPGPTGIYPSNTPVKIIYPGGSSHDKSADIVALALRRLLKTNLDFKFYWIGFDYVAGGRHFGLPIRHISQCFPLDDPRIVQFGRVERDEARRMLAEADIFLLPSRLEGFPISLCEALAGAAIPIISDAPHGSLDLIRNGSNGIVVPQGSVSAIVDAITDIIRHPDNYRDMRQAAFASVAESLSPQVWTTSMRRIFDMPLDHAPRRPFSPLRFRISALRYRLSHLRRLTINNLHLIYNLAFYTCLLCKRRPAPPRI